MARARWRNRQAGDPEAGERVEGAAAAADATVPGPRGGPGARAAGGEAPAPPYLRAGRYAWATLGLVGLLALALLVLARLRLIVAPLVLALFPAALLWPLTDRLRRARVPGAVVSLVSILALLAAIAGLLALVVPAVIAELPDLIDSFAEGLQRVDGLLRRGFFGVQVDGLAGLADTAREQLAGADALATGALQALVSAVEVFAGFALLLVALFFYLKDGRRLVHAMAGLLPAPARGHAVPVGQRVWDTLGGFLRGQLLVALVDAVFIGLGLALLGVPLAFPLAVIVFFGGLFPIVGAFLSGLVAVLVALADGGLLIALAALAIVVGVQQVESNVLEPLVLGRVVRLHPLVVIAAIGAGGILAGILGAFLAVPIAASLARGVEYARGDRQDGP